MTSVRAAEIRVQGRPGRYWRAGDVAARPVLLLHGGLGDAALHWQRNLAGLGRDFAVLAPDLPGFGRTAALPHPSYPAYGEWVAAFCDAAGAGPDLTVVGNSMGGAVARVFAAAYPARVARLVLVDGGQPFSLPGAIRWVLGVPPLRALLLALARRQACSPAALHRYVADPARLTPSQRARMRRGIRAYIRVQRQILAAPPVPAAALEVRCPVLVVWGAQDGLGSPASGRRLAAELGAALTIVDGAGHLPMLEQPAAFGGAVRGFVAATAGGTAVEGG
ncbi:MAG TPA: alpha/beta hydrolase [Chloroflexia bacterium]|nr:alpha/beta hydrolase [Chloroflexia bacterium]